MSRTLVFNDRNGRFGNKLFQIAATIATARKNNLSYGTHFDLNVNHIFKNILPIIAALPAKTYSQLQWNYYDIILDGSHEFLGYYQSEKFFSNIKDEIFEIFAFKDDLVKLKELYPSIGSTCGIHVRRTDYLTQQDFHPVTPKNYFLKAIEQTSCRKFSVFSDDIEWCKEAFRDIDCKFYSLQPHEDFVLMSLCQDNIICNSTFSWWAAYLNKNPNKKIICPTHSKWFGIGYNNFNTTDIYPEKWIQINYDA